MQFKNVVIDTVACALPEDRWSSERIESELAPLYSRLSLPLGRLEMMTGIYERRHWAADFLPSEAAIKAGEALFQKTKYPREEIDVLIHASVCRNRLEPATAAYVHQGLKLSAKTQIFDISNACLGVLNAMIVGASMIEAGTAQSVLIVSGENGKPLLDHTIQQLNQDSSINRRTLKPYFANLTIGSGAVAILLCSNKQSTEPKPLLLGGIVRTNSDANCLCEGDAISKGLDMRTDATALLEAGIKLSQEGWQAFKHTMHWSEDTPKHIITHQVGLQHQKRLYEALNLDVTKDFSTFPFLGNTGSVALPISLCFAEKDNRLQMGDNVLLLGIGSGLSTLMLGVLWQK